jgi:macrolide transport system ATP-binding/permease protein
MATFWQDLRYAFRTLRNSPGFSIIAVVTLGLGMAVNTTIFSVINGLLLRPLPVPHAEQLTVLGLQAAGTPDVQAFSYPDYLDIRSQTDSFSDVFAYRPTLGSLVVDGKGDHCVLSRVTGNYFSALGVKPALGRLILPNESQAPGADPILVLGYSYWQKRFAGDPSVVGKQAQINDRPVTIVGVAPKGFHGTYAIIDMDGYVPLSASVIGVDKTEDPVRKMWTAREDRSLSLLGRLKPGVSLKQAQAKLSVVAQRIAEQHPDTDKGVTFRAYPEKLARPEPDPDNTLPAVALAFTALAALVLLVACFNIANVLLVRATARQREMGIRAALGAGRVRLVRQHLTESLLLALLGGGAGLVLATWAAGFLSALPLGTDLPISFDFQPDTRVYFYAFAAVLLTGLVVGIFPALRVARSDVNSVLREGGRGSSDGRRRHFVRNTLVVAQLAGSMLLLIVAGLFLRSLSKARQTYLGFNTDHVLDLTLDVQQAGMDETRGRAFYKQIDERIAAMPGVVSVAQAFVVPMGVISADNPLCVEGRPVEPGKPCPTVMYNPVTPAYFQTLQIPLQQGRAFREADEDKSPKVAVINQTMAKQFWPNENPLGKRFGSAPAGPFVEVVGVVADAKYKNVIETPSLPYYYVPINQQYMQLRTIHVRTSVPPETLAPQIQAQIHEVASEVPITQVQNMGEAMNGINGFFFFRFGAQLSGTMGLLGLILAVVGVYSVVSYAASQRTHEIGIRMALGAKPSHILKMVLRQSLLVVVIGIAVGLGIALAGAQAIAGLLVGIKPSDPITFFGAMLLLSAVALIAVWVPARRATRVSPLVALRYE